MSTHVNGTTVPQDFSGGSLNHAAVVVHRKLGEDWKMSDFERLEREVSSWPQVSVHPHRFGAREFRFGAAEIGHVHNGGIVDIPFTRPIHDELLNAGMAVEHRWVPNSGWVTFCVRNSQELKQAIWLLRLSYLRYVLKTAENPQEMLQHESDKLHLSSRLRTLLEMFIPKLDRKASAEPIST